MQPVSPTAIRYDRTTIAVHWATAILVAAQWLGAPTIDWFPNGPLKVDARSVHVTFGLLLAVVLAGRVVWRLTEGRRLPPAEKGLLQVIAKATHWTLNLLVAAMLVAGVALAWVRATTSSTCSPSPLMVQATASWPTGCRTSTPRSAG